jgi:hypothetical protein
MSAAVSSDFLTQQLQLADQLLAGRATMLEPQDLPGRYGRVVQAVDRVLASIGCPAALGGGWAVWRHGYVGRVTQDLDIVLPAAQIAEFLRGSVLAGFEAITVPLGIWPKVRHKDTGIHVDILPEGERPGTASRPAPTTIPHPHRLGASPGKLSYVTLPALIELKLAAGRARDQSDIIELIRANADQIEELRRHLVGVHTDYVTAFDELVQRAQEQDQK